MIRMPRRLYSAIIWSRTLALKVEQPFPAAVKTKVASVWVVRVVAGIIITFILLSTVLFFWYKQQLQSKDFRGETKIRFSIAKGESVAEISRGLEKKGIIKSGLAMQWYLRFERSASTLQAGRYALSPRLSVPDLVKHLESGKTDLFMITILPGSTISAIKKKLLSYGYSDKEIDAALRFDYKHPLLADRPAGQSLEGYIFPETFEMQSTANLESLFMRDFDTLYDRLKTDGLIERFKARGLNLHQALTLASIIQKETSLASDQTQVAQVFYRRLELDMKLETDPTFIYAAEIMGVEPSVRLDSPYNTRLYKGLPPGPIGNMEYTALLAVAEPANTDFLYFVAGDDGTNYFSHTLEEHEAYVQKYCRKLCN